MSKRRLLIIISVLTLIITATSLIIFPRKQLVGESLQVQILEHLFKPLDLIFIHLAFAPNRLPVYEITTTQTDLQRLYDSLPKTKSQEEIRQKRFLANRVYIPTTLRFDDKEYKAKVTVQGGIPSHYLGEKKSFRVRLEKDQKAPFSGINFIIPEDSNFIDTHVSYFLSQNLNLFMPKPGFARLKLNSVNLGVYETLYDDQDNSILELGQLSTGNLILREEAKPQFIAQGSLSNLFNESGAWKLANSPETPDPAPLSAIEKLKKINGLEGQEFYEALPEIIDMDQFMKFLAHNFIMGDSHQSSDANQVLIFVKEKGRFWFIPEENTINPVDSLQGLRYNDFFEKILNNPQNFWYRNEVLWSLVNNEQLKAELSKQVDSLYETIKGPIYQDEKKAFRFFAFRAKVKSQKQAILDNLDKIKNYYSDYYVESNVLNTSDFPTPAIAAIKIKANSFFQPSIQSINFKFKNKTQATIKVYLDLNENEKLDSSDELITSFSVNNTESYTTEINKPLKFQKFLESTVDRLKPTAISNLFVVSEQKVNLEEVKLNFSNSLTGQGLETTTHMIDGSFFAQKLPLPDFIKKLEESKFVIGPGAITVNDDVFIPEGELEIRPGTTLSIAPSKSIISLARVLAKGTAQSPITITAQKPSQNWGSFLIIGPHQKPNEFDHIIVQYGSGIHRYGYIATGSLAIHFDNIILTNSQISSSFDDDGINVKHGHAQIINNLFSNTKSDAIDFDTVTGEISNNQFINIGTGSDNGDGIDISFSNVTIKENKVQKASDKCISIGEGSKAQVMSNLLKSCDLGIAVKDGATATIINNTLKDNRIAITAYMKKPIYGKGGEVSLGKNIFEGNQKDKEIDQHSAVLDI